MASAACKFETLPWSALTQADRDAWRRMRSARPALASPFFSLGWSDAVNLARGDVEVVRAAQADRPLAFLPFTRAPFGVLRPAGAPLSDWHGVVSGEDLELDVEDLLRAARGRAFSFSGACVDDPALAAAAARRATSFVMDLSGGYGAYEADRRKTHAKAFRNLKSRSRRLEDHHVEFRLDDRDPSSLAALLAMKRAQYRRTGQIDIFSFRWTRELIETLFAAEAGGRGVEVRGLLSTLWIDGVLAAAHLGLQADGSLHYWFPVYGQQFAAMSPGIVLLHKIAGASGDLGFDRIDLGDGSYRFKDEFANRQLPIIAGVARLTGAGRALPAQAPAPRRDRSASPLATLGRVPHGITRRLDLLSALYRGPSPKPRRA